MAQTILTESRVKEIVREETEIYSRQLSLDIAAIREDSKYIKRLLLGEEGGFAEENLKAKADFAYKYARRNTDLLLPERVQVGLKWFEDMAGKESGEKESKLVTLGKMIIFYRNITWLINLIGITTVLNTIITAIMLLERFGVI